VTFFAATNRKKDRAGVAGILEPVKSRFLFIVQLETNFEDWVEWALRNNYPPELTGFIRFRPPLLHQFEPDKNREDEMQQFPCPRTVAHVGDIMMRGYPEELHYELFEGAIGKGFAAEFKGFLEIYKRLPNPDNVIKRPDKAKVPDDPAVLYALTAALAARANEENMENIIAYSSRLNDASNFPDDMARPEFSVALVRDCIRRDPEIQNTAAFIDWASEHADVIIN